MGEEIFLQTYANTLEPLWVAGDNEPSSFAIITMAEQEARRGYVRLSGTWLDGVRRHLETGARPSPDLSSKVNITIRRHLDLVRAGYGTAYPLLDTLLTVLKIDKDALAEMMRGAGDTAKGLTTLVVIALILWLWNR